MTEEKKRMIRSFYWIMGYVIITIILTYIENKKLFPLYSRQVGSTLPTDVLEQILESAESHRWIIYIKKSLNIIVRIIAVSISLYSGILFNSSINDKKFINCWVVGVKSYLAIMLFFTALSIYNIVTLQVDSDSFFVSISLLRWFDSPDIIESAPWLYILLLSVNLQELVNILFISILVHLYMRFSFGSSIWYVLKTYGVLLLLVLVVCVIMTV